MPQHSDRMYVGHMRDACAKVTRHITGFDWPAFQQDEKTQDAVIRALEIIGEAGSNVSAVYRSLYPEIPWRVVKDLRNALIHEYSNVRLDLPRKPTWRSQRRGHRNSEAALGGPQGVGYGVGRAYAAVSGWRMTM